VAAVPSGLSHTPLIIIIIIIIMASATFSETMENNTFCTVYSQSQVIHYAPTVKIKGREGGRKERKKERKVYSNLEYTYIPIVFFEILHISVVRILICCT
jgi:hypothetical protein